MFWEHREWRQSLISRARMNTSPIAVRETDILGLSDQATPLARLILREERFHLICLSARLCFAGETGTPTIPLLNGTPLKFRAEFQFIPTQFPQVPARTLSPALLRSTI